MMERKWAPGKAGWPGTQSQKWMCTSAQRSCKALTGYPVDD